MLNQYYEIDASSSHGAGEIYVLAFLSTSQPGDVMDVGAYKDKKSEGGFITPYRAVIWISTNAVEMTGELLIVTTFTIGAGPLTTADRIQTTYLRVWYIEVK